MHFITLLFALRKKFRAVELFLTKVIITFVNYWVHNITLFFAIQQSLVQKNYLIIPTVAIQKITYRVSFSPVLNNIPNIIIQAYITSLQHMGIHLCPQKRKKTIIITKVITSLKVQFWTSVLNCRFLTHTTTQCAFLFACCCFLLHIGVTFLSRIIKNTLHNLHFFI